jgi:hypothetical protein
MSIMWINNNENNENNDNVVMSKWLNEIMKIMK